MSMLSWFDNLTQDIQYGLRQLVARPGFSLAAVLSLALGIGANTAIFTLVDQVLIRLLPVERPAELVRLRVDGGRFGNQSGDGVHTFPFPTYVALRDQNTVFSGLTGQRVEQTSLIHGDRNELISVAMVAGNYFQVLGLKAHIGRLLTPDEDRLLDGHPVAVLQYDFWQARFAGKADILGQTVRLNGKPFTIVGVAAPGYEGTDVGFPNKIWVPITMRPTITPTNPRLDDERSSWFYVFGRLKPGVSMEQAQASLRVLYRQRQEVELKHELFTKFPESKERFLKQTFLLEPAERGDSSLGSRLEQPLKILQWLVGAVLLIACSNVAGLLLAKSASRQRELAIRAAMGAGRGRLILQLLSEGLLLALAGGAGGVLLGAWLTRMLIGSLPFDPSTFTISATPDLRILSFALAMTFATVLIFGLIPAWQSSRVSPAMTMRDEAGSVIGGHGQVRLRKLFVGLQVGLSVMLLLAAGLFVRTLTNLKGVDIGMHREDIVTFGVRPAEPYDDARKLQLYRSLVESLASVPGVKAVGANQVRLFMGGRSDGSITIPGVDEKRAPDSFFNLVTPGYFDALGMPVKAGRDVRWSDWTGGRKVALVNERLANEYFPGSSPVGRMMARGMRVDPDTEIIGVVADSRYHRVQGEVPRQTFVNMDGNIKFVTTVNVYARVTGDPRQLMKALREASLRVDRDLVITDMRTLDDQINVILANERLISYLSAAFAILATVLAIVGLHGVLAFVVARRTREIGVRMALGAARGRIIALVASETMLVVLGGLILGAGAGYYCGRFVESQLFGVKAHDPVVFAIAIATVVMSTLIGTLLPAYRAARIDPMNALRYE